MDWKNRKHALMLRLERVVRGIHNARFGWMNPYAFLRLEDSATRVVVRYGSGNPANEPGTSKPLPGRFPGADLYCSVNGPKYRRNR